MRASILSTIAASALVMSAFAASGCAKSADPEESVAEERSALETGSLVSLDPESEPSLLPPQGKTPVGGAKDNFTCQWQTQNASYCYVDIENAILDCADNVASDVRIIDTDSGIVLEVDMAGHKMLQVGTKVAGPHGYALHIADSPSNNGWAGDGGDFSNDSEALLYENTMFVWGSDRVGNPNLLKAQNVIPDGDGVLWAGVCDGKFLLYSWDFTNPATNALVTSVDGLFQIDGNEPDNENGGVNDTKLYVGLERTVGSSSRTGSDLYSAPWGGPVYQVLLLLAD
ncbi:MAG: hypothetical protein U0441_16000 [Polyangiaceae bacterium]